MDIGRLAACEVVCAMVPRYMYSSSSTGNYREGMQLGTPTPCKPRLELPDQLGDANFGGIQQIWRIECTPFPNQPRP